MKMIRYLFFVIVILFSGTVSAVTVSVVSGKSVGLNDAGYFAGIVTLDIDGVEYPAMMIDWFYNIIGNPGWETDYTPWEAVLYTRDDTLAGANVLYTPAEYSMASRFFLDGMLGYNPADPLWVSSYNEMMWNVTASPGFWTYADREYPASGSGVTLHDVYNMDVAAGLDPNYDYSGFMGILSYPDNLRKEFLVFSAVPVPPAIWLFGSGLVGLVAVARKKQQ